MNYFSGSKRALFPSLKVAVVSGALLLSACGEEDVSASGQMHIERAKAYQSQGQYKAAGIEYRNAVKKSGDEAGIVAYADMLNRLGQNGTALKLLEEYEGPKSQAFYIEQVEAFVGRRKYLSAEATLKDFVTLDNRDVSILEAKVLTGLNEHGKALEIYENLLSQNSSDGDALLGKAESLLRSKRLDEATKLLMTINKENEAYIKAQILISGIQIASTDLGQAESTLSELLTHIPNTDIMEPEKIVILERLSYVLTRLGRSNEAYIYTKLLSEAFPGANEMNEKYSSAIRLFEEGDLEKSKALLEELTADYPGNTRAHQLLGVVSYLQGDAEKAYEAFTGNVDPEIADPLATHIYAASTFKMNAPKKVLEILDSTIQRNTKAETWALYGLAALSDGQTNKAENALNKAISLAPDDPKMRLVLASFHRSASEDPAKELEQLNLAYELAPTDLSILKEVFRFHIREGDKKAAGSLVDKQVSSYPEEYSSHYLAGYYNLSTKNLEKAGYHFGLASELNASDVYKREAFLSKGKVELALNNFGDANKTFRKVIDQNAEDYLGYQGVYKAILGADGEEKAIQVLEKLAKEKSSLMPYAVLVRDKIAKSDLDSASRYIEKIKEMDPDSKLTASLERDLVYKNALSAMLLQQFDQAREFIAPLLISEPENPKLLSFLVELELKSGHVTEAEKVLGQLELLKPNLNVLPVLKGDVAVAKKDWPVAKSQYTQAWNVLSSELVANKLYKVLDLLKDRGAAKRHLDDWRSKLPNSQSAMLFSAMHEQVDGNTIEAAKGYEALLKLSPENVTALNNLGWIYYEAKDDRALALLKKASSLAPNNPAVLDSYGWVLVQNGDVDEGISYLEKAYELAPSIDEIKKHLEEAKKLR